MGGKLLDEMALLNANGNKIDTIVQHRNRVWRKRGLTFSYHPFFGNFKKQIR